MNNKDLTPGLVGQFDPTNRGQGLLSFQKRKAHNPFFNFCTQTINFSKSLSNLAVEQIILNYKYE